MSLSQDHRPKSHVQRHPFLALGENKSSFDVVRGKDDPKIMHTMLTTKNEVFVFDGNYQLTKYKLQPELKQVWTKTLENMDYNKLGSLPTILIIPLPNNKILLEMNRGEYELHCSYYAVIDDGPDQQLHDVFTMVEGPYFPEPIQSYIPISETRFAYLSRCSLTRMRTRKYPTPKIFIFETSNFNPKKPLSEIDLNNFSRSINGTIVDCVALDEKTLFIFGHQAGYNSKPGYFMRFREGMSGTIYEENNSKKGHYQPISSIPIFLTPYFTLPENYKSDRTIVFLPEKRYCYLLEHFYYCKDWVGQIIQIKLTLLEFVGNQFVEKYHVLLTYPDFDRNKMELLPGKLIGAYVASDGLAKLVIKAPYFNVIMPDHEAKGSSLTRVYDGETLASFQELSFSQIATKGIKSVAVNFPTPQSVTPESYNQYFQEQKRLPDNGLGLAGQKNTLRSNLAHVSKDGHLIFASWSLVASSPQHYAEERQAPFAVVTYNYDTEYKKYLEHLKSILTTFPLEMARHVVDYFFDTLSSESYIIDGVLDSASKKQQRISQLNDGEEADEKEEKDEKQCVSVTENEKITVETLVKVQQVAVEVKPAAPREAISYDAFKRVVTSYSSKSWVANCFFSCFGVSLVRSGAMRALNNLLDDVNKPNITNKQIEAAIRQDKYSERRLNLFEDFSKTPNGTATDNIIQSLSMEFLRQR